eukprot:CAMPEP_0170955830 /NCGR_PEP_ID=MMETSP0735-20130129/33475_1 /TAXON_ID=186038 /ORGANISM="Fragilariopsis kerguelensis, Strain L26-C5" /LENGTH=55 /DNA_ID=CAMNT_0011367901 /DNA_START=294 /DNA_END=461 /DNA_ORIENTATION=+
MYDDYCDYFPNPEDDYESVMESEEDNDRSYDDDDNDNNDNSNDVKLVGKDDVTIE